MTFLKDKIPRPIGLALLSGVFVGTSYIPFPPWALFFCFCPLWSTYLKETNPKKIFLYGWITQFLFVMIGFHWIPGTISDFGNMPWVVGLIGLLAFAGLTNLHIPLAGVAWFYLHRFLKQKNIAVHPLASLMGIALLTVVLGRMLPQIFPWYLGYGWYYGDLPAYQLADTIGITGLSTLTYLGNAWILFIYLNIKNKKIFRYHVTYLILIFASLNAIGIYKNYAWSKTDASLNVLMVQPNIGNQEKQWELYGPQFKTKIIQKHFELTSQALALPDQPKPDLIVWPETSIPEYLGHEYYNVNNVAQILQYIRNNHVSLLTGAYTKNVKTEQDSNAVFLFDENAKSLGVYKKHILLAFGEYMPFSGWFPILLKLVPTVADFERGVGPHVLNFHDIKLGPQICYEGLHPWFTQELIKQNADILVNVTNDSWFGHTFESYQHLYMTFARAVEFRRPMVRVTNTGISAAVSATGQLLEFSPQKVEWAKTITVPYLKTAPRSIYSYFLYTDLLLAIFAIILIFRFDILTRSLIDHYQRKKS